MLHVLTHSVPTRRTSSLYRRVSAATRQSQLQATLTRAAQASATLAQRYYAAGNLPLRDLALEQRSEEHTSELQSLMRISYAVFCLKKTRNITQHTPKPNKTQLKSYKRTQYRRPTD